MPSLPSHLLGIVMLKFHWSCSLSHSDLGRSAVCLAAWRLAMFVPSVVQMMVWQFQVVCGS